jgi:hypothetical protein
MGSLIRSGGGDVLVVVLVVVSGAVDAMMRSFLES